MQPKETPRDRLVPLFQIVWPEDSPGNSEAIEEWAKTTLSNATTTENAPFLVLAFEHPIGISAKSAIRKLFSRWTDEEFASLSLCVMAFQLAPADPKVPDRRAEFTNWVSTLFAGTAKTQPKSALLLDTARSWGSDTHMNYLKRATRH